jgi:hypothetical protein
MRAPEERAARPEEARSTCVRRGRGRTAGDGWPVYRGGPVFYADTVSPAQVVGKLEAHGPGLGKGFMLFPLLKRLTAKDKRFGDLK